MPIEFDTSVTCPVCDDSAPKTLLYHYSARQAASHFCPITRDANRHERLLKCIRRLWTGDESVVLRCHNCSFGFGYPFVGGDDEFYGILHEQSGYSRWTWDFEAARRSVLQDSSGGHILDVGAGVGNFLKKLDPCWEPFATEGSSNVAASGSFLIWKRRHGRNREPLRSLPFFRPWSTLPVFETC